ncbi:kinase-like protein [Hortaea werneckii]|nr:kinase-like protein [Hortaea werneckii]
MASTITGESGRKYTRGKVLQNHRANPSLSVFMADSEDDHFVVKRVTRPFYDLSKRLASEFGSSSRLRMHVDCNDEEAVLVFPYYETTLLALIQGDPEFPTEGRMKVLRQVGEAIQELHSKDWMHLDVKPDNVLVNCNTNEEGCKAVADAALGDFDLVCKCEQAKPLHTPYAIGNVMWRSPEGQTGRGVTKASDIYSFGLVCIYALGGGDLLLLNNYQELAGRGITPEKEILTRHFAYFGPVPDAVFEDVGDENWSAALKGAAGIADELVKDDPRLRFERWGEELGPEALRMIAGMVVLNPKARLDINKIMAHPFWEEDA